MVLGQKSYSVKVQTLGTGQIEQDGTSLRSFQTSPVAAETKTDMNVKVVPEPLSPSPSPSPSPSIFSFFSHTKKQKKTATTPSKSSPPAWGKDTSNKYLKKNSSTLTSATAIEQYDDVNDNIDVSSSDNAIGLDLSDDSRPSSPSLSPPTATLIPTTKIDTSSDLAYHSQQEKDDCELILNKHLTVDEIESMPDPFMVVRHYRAEKGDVSKAVDAIRHTLEWRREFGVHDIVHAFERKNEMSTVIRRENQTGKVYVRGYDVDGRACMYMRPGRENTYGESEYNNLAHLVFQLEKAIACSQKNGQGKICLIIDYEGFTIAKSPPMSTSKKTLDILQKHYCERMFRVYVCNPPMYFRTFWAVIKPLVDPVTKKKVCMCHGKAGMEQIVSDMGGPAKAYKHLEKCAGGTANLKEFNVDEYLALPMNVSFDE